MISVPFNALRARPSAAKGVVLALLVSAVQWAVVASLVCRHGA